MDIEKWLNWVWVPFLGALGFFAKWTLANLTELRRAHGAADARVQQSFLENSKAMDDLISALHEKANTIRTELDAYKVEAERRFVTQAELDRTESHLTRGLTDLTRAIERLSDKVH